ncbi:DNA glycosylase [Martensiomyces pterosporus]|nr:DNA glycosylase [Martensiomyces pterosporus]
MAKTQGASAAWMDLSVGPAELRLDPTLLCGQAFRWKSTGDNEWTCALWGHAIDLKQTPTTVLYRSLGNLAGTQTGEADIELALRDYFQLHINMGELCDRWSLRDPHFAELRTSQVGVRALRQPVVENLFTFIASSNNNIKRITMLVDKLCTQYGQRIDTEKGSFYTFPTVAELIGGYVCDMESTLKKLGFGYRAKYYAKTVETLLTQHKDPEQFLLSLRDQPFEVARSELMKFSGVGPKVADCVCLGSLDKIEAVPIDTHIWQVAQKRYVGRILSGEKAASKTATPKAYKLAQQLIIRLFSPYAGWAQLLLFSDDLKPAGRNVPKSKSEKPAVKKEAAEPAAVAKDAGGKAEPSPRKRKAEPEASARRSMRLRSKRLE